VQLRDLRDIVREHGGDLYAGGSKAVIPGPGHSRKDRSLSLAIGDDGERVVFNSFANDSVRSIMDYLGIEAKARPQTPAEKAAYQRRRDHEKKVRAEQARREADADLAFCQSIWAGTAPIEGTPAEAYLWSRGLIIEASDVAFHPAAPRSKDPEKARPGPAMVAMVRSASGKPQSLHMTFLKPGGAGYQCKLMFGSVSGHSVQLAPIGADRALAVGEGIETCAAFMELHGVSTWAALSTAGLQGFVIPPGVKKLLIAADGDKGGERAALDLALRARRVCDVEIHAAPDGIDWADVLEARP
jgi:hypothetical protein